jgi:hypothetical protein
MRAEARAVVVHGRASGAADDDSSAAADGNRKSASDSATAAAATTNAAQMALLTTLTLRCDQRTLIALAHRHAASGRRLLCVCVVSTA